MYLILKCFPRFLLVSFFFACFGWLVACGELSQEPEPQNLWADERAWFKIEHGWVNAVSLQEAKLLTAENKQGSLRGDVYFRAVAFPSQAGACLEIETPAGSRQMELAGPEPLELKLPKDGQISLSTRGVEGEVYLLHPRLATARSGPGRKFLLIIADTLRLDEALDEMPLVAEYFSAGARFHQAYSPASWTLPSLASIFTGKNPAELRSPDGTLISLSSREKTLATEFSHQGFVTVGITANYTVNHENGYSKGFDLFLAPPPLSRPGDFPDAEWLLAQGQEVMSWFENDSLFLYLQPMEPHEPYRNHDKGQAQNALETGVEPSPEQLKAMREAYTSEVRYLDRRLSGFLQGSGKWDLVVFTADHGEEFFDHGGFRHGPTLYDEVVRVPLWMAGSAGNITGDFDAPVSLTALKDFLLAFADDPAEMDAHSLLGRPVTMETFSFGPPRWSGVVDDVRVIYFAQRISLASNLETEIAVSARETRIENWLRNHHPPIRVISLQDSSPQQLSRPVLQRSLRLLLRQFRGFRRGIFILLEGENRRELRLQGVEGDGLQWGEGVVKTQRINNQELLLSLAEPKPFLLLFLPVPGAESPRVFDTDSGREWKLNESAMGSEGEGEGGSGIKHISVWFDPGRPVEALQEMDETLRRLEALGYI